jgi:hypothetical protein
VRVDRDGNSLVLVSGTDRLVLSGDGVDEWETALQDHVKSRASQGESSAQGEASQALSAISRALSSLDHGLIEALRRGDIRLLRSSWVLQPSVEFVQRRQALEALELSGVVPSPFMSPEEAVELISKANRSVGALTYGWCIFAPPHHHRPTLLLASSQHPT